MQSANDNPAAIATDFWKELEKDPSTLLASVSVKFIIKAQTDPLAQHDLDVMSPALDKLVPYNILVGASASGNPGKVRHKCKLGSSLSASSSASLSSSASAHSRHRCPSFCCVYPCSSPSTITGTVYRLLTIFPNSATHTHSLDAAHE
jgi:hypothetical protein